MILVATAVWIYGKTNQPTNSSVQKTRGRFLALSFLGANLAWLPEGRGRPGIEVGGVVARKARILIGGGEGRSLIILQNGVSPANLTSGLRIGGSD